MGRGRGYNKAKFSAVTGAILQNALFATLDDDDNNNNSRGKHPNGNDNANGNDNGNLSVDDETLAAALAIVSHKDGTTTTTTKTLDTAQAMDIMKASNASSPRNIQQLVKALDLDIGEHTLHYATTMEPYLDRREKLRRKYCRRLVTNYAASEQKVRKSCQRVQQTSKYYLSLQADTIIDEAKLQILEELKALQKAAAAAEEEQFRHHQEAAATAATVATPTTRTEHEFLPISKDTSSQTKEEPSQVEDDNAEEDDEDDDPQAMKDGSSSSLNSFLGLFTSVTKCWRGPCPPREEEEQTQEQAMDTDDNKDKTVDKDNDSNANDNDNKGFLFDPASLNKQDNVKAKEEGEDFDTASETEASETLASSSRSSTPATLPSVAENVVVEENMDTKVTTEDHVENTPTPTPTPILPEANAIPTQLSPIHYLFMSLMRPPDAVEPTIVVETAKDLKRLKAAMVRACLTQPEIQRLLQRSPLVEQMEFLHTDGGGSDKFCTKNMKTCRCEKHKDCHEVAVRTLVDSFVNAFVQVKSKK